MPRLLHHLSQRWGARGPATTPSFPSSVKWDLLHSCHDRAEYVSSPTGAGFSRMCELDGGSVNLKYITVTSNLRLDLSQLSPKARQSLAANGILRGKAR